MEGGGGRTKIIAFLVFNDFFYGDKTKIHSVLESILIRAGPTPCTGLGDARLVPARPYPMLTRFQVCWRGQTFYRNLSIIGLLN